MHSSVKGFSLTYFSRDHVYKLMRTSGRILSPIHTATSDIDMICEVLYSFKKLLPLSKLTNVALNDSATFITMYTHKVGLIPPQLLKTNALSSFMQKQTKVSRKIKCRVPPEIHY